MRKSLTLLVILFFSLASTGLLISGQNQEDEKFQKAVDEYLEAYWKFYPTAATMAGFHKFDDKLEDLGKGNIEKRYKELDELNQEFVVKVTKPSLSPEAQIDHEIMVDAVDMETIRHEMLLPWSYNPLFYNDIFANCVRSLMTGDFGNPEERAKNAADRLDDLPKLIKQAKENLDTPPQIYTETAIKQFPGIIDFYKNELPQLIAQAPASRQGKLQENLAKVIPDLEDYQSFLSNELLAKSTGNFRLASAHSRMLRIAWKNDLPQQDLIARSQADRNNIRREILLVCIPFYKIMDPRFDIENPPANLAQDEDRLINAIVSHVIANIKTEHVTREGFVEKLKEVRDSVKAFIQAKQLIDFPGTDLDIVDMPPEAQGLTWVRLQRPNAYGETSGYSLQIAPFAEGLSDDQATSLLEEYNNYFLPFYVTRKICPGEYVPFYFADRNSSMIRNLYPSLPLVKGWPLFVEEMMILNGFGNYDLRMRLNQLKYRLKTAIDFVLDLNIHQGSMTKEDAMAFMMRTGFQTEAEAERNWTRIILNPGDATFAYVGLQEFLDIQKTYKQSMGDGYSDKEFLSKLLSYGNIPLRNLKAKFNQ